MRCVDFNSTKTRESNDIFVHRIGCVFNSFLGTRRFCEKGGKTPDFDALVLVYARLRSYGGGLCRLRSPSNAGLLEASGIRLYYETPLEVEAQNTHRRKKSDIELFSIFFY